MLESGVRRLGRRFYRRSSPELARALLGKRLVHRGRAGIIVETEAYLGPEDAASHARFGITRRNAVMFGEAGFSYVYLCYGMYDLFNVVAGREGQPGAVLIRALAPDRGLPDDPRVARGPGKLTRALGITRAHSEIDLCAGPDLCITEARRVPDSTVATGPRIGVDYAGAWAREPLRFWIRDHASVS
jgi:DNA-3-methyladenine glycosylase